MHTALHIRTAEPALADLVDSWLATHRVACHTCADVYEACVHLIKRSSDVPDFVFVGSDWLTADDFLILRYLRETWPSAAIIVYGTRPTLEAAVDEPLRRVCASRRDLLSLLEHPPLPLLRLLREAGGERELAGENRDTRLAAGTPPASPEPASSPEEEGRPGTGLASEAGRDREAEASVPRTILTDEELSALLDGEES